MWVWIDRLALILFDATLSAAVFLSVVVLANLVCRQPTRRLLIARVALFASLAILPLVAVAPLPRLDLVRVLLRADLLPGQQFTNYEEIVSRADTSAPGETARSFPKEFPKLVPIAGRWLPRAVTMLDVAGVAAGVAWLFLGIWGVHWLIESSDEPSPATRGLYEQLTPAAAVRARPPLRVSSHIERPVVVGWWWPTILIPATFEGRDSDPEHLRLSLLHEVAHVEQSDHFYGMVATLAQAIWFFLPQIWWLRSQLLIDQEFLADRSAASRYGTPSGYAASLLTVAQARPGSMPGNRPIGAERTWPVATKTEDLSPLFQRVLMLLNCPFQVEAQPPGLWSWISRVVVIGLSIGAACLYIRWPSAQGYYRGPADDAVRQPYSFRVIDFVSEPLVFPPGERALPYVMPVALPAHFDLTVEVFSSLADLAQIRVAGHPLGPFKSQGDPSPDKRGRPPADIEVWHRVHLECMGNKLTLRVDDCIIPVTSSPATMPQWLTFEPGPGRTAQFRNLVLAW